MPFIRYVSNCRISFAHPLLERIPFFQRQAVRLGDNGHNIDNFTQLLHDDDVDRSERVASRIDEKQATVDTRVLDVAVANGCELLAKVCAVLVLDVLDDWVPARFCE